jgi:hypothetical protein
MPTCIEIGGLATENSVFDGGYSVPSRKCWHRSSARLSRKKIQGGVIHDPTQEGWVSDSLTFEFTASNFTTRQNNSSVP